MPRPPASTFNDQHVTQADLLDRAVRSYWQRRFPGRPGRVLIVDRQPRKQAAA